MKKVCVLLLIQLLFGTSCYGAVSQDVYVRKDVFDANMQGINTKLDILLEQMKDFKEEMKVQREEHNTQMKELREEMKTFKEEQKAQVAELRNDMREFKEEQKTQIAELREEMKAMRQEFHDEMKAVRQDIAELTRAISVLSTRVDGIDKRMDGIEARISNLKSDLDGRIGDLRNDIYLGLVVLGIVVGLPAVQKMFQSWAERKPSLTADDVRRLIEEAISNRAASSSGN